MQLFIDLDIALFSVRHKLDKELRAYYFFRELSRNSSGYIGRKEAIAAYMEKAGASYGTANRRVNALCELGWAIKAKSGNVHINGLYRVKTLLNVLHGPKMGFVWRRRTALLDLFAPGGKNTLDSFKGSLAAALTADKLNRDLHREKVRISKGQRMSKADIGKALASVPHLGCYAHRLKCEDWNLSAGTVNRRKKVSEKLKLELYDWQRVEGLHFASRDEAIQGAIALGYVDRHFRKVFYKNGSFGLRDADKIRTRVELFRRGKPNHLKALDLMVKVSGVSLEMSSARILKDKEYSYAEKYEEQEFVEQEHDPFAGDGPIYADSMMRVPIEKPVFQDSIKGIDKSSKNITNIPTNNTPYSSPFTHQYRRTGVVNYLYSSSVFEKSEFGVPLCVMFGK